MKDNVRDEILVYLANSAETMSSAKKDFRRVEGKALPKLEVDFRYGKRFFNDSAICGEEFLMFKHEGRLLRLKDCCGARLEINETKEEYRKTHHGRRIGKILIVLAYIALMLGLTWFIYGQFCGYSLTEGFRIGTFLLILAGLVLVSVIFMMIFPAFSNNAGTDGAWIALGGLLEFVLESSEGPDTKERYIPTMYLRMRFIPDSRIPERVDLPLRIGIPKEEELEEFNRYLAEQISHQTALRQAKKAHGS